MPTTLKELLDGYGSAMRQGSAALFVGAGMSRENDLPVWKELMRRFVDDLGLNIDRESDLLELTQYYLNHKRGTRSRLNQVLKEIFGGPFGPALATHRTMAKLPIPTVWTTNFDKLLEAGFREENKRVAIRVTDCDFATSSPGEKVLNKMHGDVDRLHEAILSQDDIDQYAKTHAVFQKALDHDLATKTFLFLGVSFRDPNLNSRLVLLRETLGASRRTHYAIMRKARLSFEDPNPKALEEYEYAITKQQHHIDNLMTRYGVDTLLVDNFSDIANLLDELELKSRRENVFVSGSVGGTGSPTHLDAFCEKLGVRLIKKGFRPAADFRSDVGRGLLRGALKTMKERDLSPIENYLLRSLPTDLTNADTNTAFDRECRKRMAKESGFAILIGGGESNDEELRFDFDADRRTKTDSGTEADSGTERREGGPNTPISPAPSGSAFLHIWNAVKSNWKSLKVLPLETNDLNDKNAEHLLDDLFGIINTISSSVPDISSKPSEKASDSARVTNWMRTTAFFVAYLKSHPGFSPHDLSGFIDSVEAQFRKTADGRPPSDIG